MDEGQNTTKEQMKMFLTRMGPFAVINGDNLHKLIYQIGTIQDLEMP